LLLSLQIAVRDDYCYVNARAIAVESSGSYVNVAADEFTGNASYVFQRAAEGSEWIPDIQELSDNQVGGVFPALQKGLD